MYCLVVFVLNEGERFLSQLVLMAGLSNVVDILVADGGSTDGSTSLDGLKAGRVRALLTSRGPRGLGVQMRMAFDFALAEGYAGVIVVDGNNKDDTSAVPLLVDALDRGIDHAQGSRFIAGGHAVNTPRDRLLAIKLLHIPAIRVAAGWPYTDTTNGFRAYSGRLLADPRVDVFRDVFRGYELHYYLAIRAARLRFAIEEVPVTRRYPKGTTPTKIGGVRGQARVLAALLRACVGAYNPGRELR